MPNAIDNPELYNSLTIGGVRSPGLLTLKGHDRKIGWDEKAGNGQQGASLTLKNIPLTEFDATFFLSERSEFDEWGRFQAVLESTYKPTVKALAVVHPELQRLGITAVVASVIPAPVRDGKGGESYTVKLKEYKPPAKKGGTASGSSAKAATKNDPNAAAKAELKKVQDQYKATKWA